MATHEEAMFPELEGLKSSRSYAVHAACEKCHRLHPVMHFAMDLLQFSRDLMTDCCGAHAVNWKFLVATRKGKINLTTRSRVAAVQKRGVWLCMAL